MSVALYFPPPLLASVPIICPVDVTRACIVAFVRVLVGRAELITPEMERDVSEQLAKFDGPSAPVREAARREIDKYGRFANTILGQVAAHATDAQTRSRVQRLSSEMRQRPLRRIE